MRIISKTIQYGDDSNLVRRLELRLTGFSVMRQVQINDVVRAIDRLPVFHLAGLREINYLDEQAAVEFFNESGQVFLPGRKGVFVQAQRRIVLAGIDDPKLFYHVLYHEIGHYVYFLIINSSLKMYWVNDVYPHAECITSYGQTNAAEDFAETYATYLLNPEMLKKIPEKYAFMDNLVFSGQAVTLKERV